MSDISKYKTWCVLRLENDSNGEPSVYDINRMNNTKHGELEMIRQEKGETKEWVEIEFRKWLDNKPVCEIKTIKEFVKQPDIDGVIQFCKLKGWKNYSVLDENHKKVI